MLYTICNTRIEHGKFPWSVTPSTHVPNFEGTAKQLPYQCIHVEGVTSNEGYKAPLEGGLGMEGEREGEGVEEEERNGEKFE